MRGFLHGPISQGASETPVVLQNVVRREVLAAILARMTHRTELGPLRTLPTARHVRVESGLRLGPAQCAQTSRGNETFAQAARRV